MSPLPRLALDFPAHKRYKEIKEDKAKDVGNVSLDGVLEVGKGIPIIPEILYSTIPLCSCQPNINSLYAHGIHRFPLLVTDSEQTERGQELVIFLNHTRLKIQT